jgi:hypothetical protein
MTQFKDLENGERFATKYYPNGTVFTKDHHDRNRECPIGVGCTNCGNKKPYNAYSDAVHRVHFCPDQEVIVK